MTLSSEPTWITRDPIAADTVLAGLAGSGDGAVLLFLGVVRDSNDGREVDHLEYDAYAEMAGRVLETIVGEARSRWETGEIRAVHRIGRLAVGEASVAIAVASPHREESYAASRYIIEELKRRMPIWKKEGYVDGRTEWLGGATPPAGEQPDG